MVKELTRECGPYVFFATAWSAVRGGVNSFNIDLCTGIAARGVKVHVFLPNGAPRNPDIPANVILHDLPSTFEKLDRSAVQAIKEALGSAAGAIWVGHDAVTGGAALFTKGILGGSAVLFHHMDYSNYYYLKQTQVAEKIRTQKHLIKTADIVFAIGPRLYDSAKHLRHAHAETYEFTPGIPAIKKQGKKSFDYRIALCGRLDPTEERVKNISTAVRAAQRNLAQLPNGRGSITLIGAPDNGSHGIRPGGSDQSVAVNAVPYIETRQEYYKELCDCDLLLMPSVKEGFGLVAWEAMSLGIPVLVSRSSGVYEFLQRRGLAELVGSVEIQGVSAIDESVIAAEIHRCFQNYSLVQESALRVAKELQTNTWDAAVDRFFSLTLPCDNGPSENSPSVIDERTLQQAAPQKSRSLSLDKEAHTGGFERFEDLLALTSRRRELIWTKSETTDYSRGRRVKFEYWVAHSPQPVYFLYVHHSSNLRQTVKRFASLLKSRNSSAPADLFVLRRDKSEPNYIQALVQEESLGTRVHDYTFKEYIWEYCIDAEFKKVGAEAPINYVDQAIVVNGRAAQITARELLSEKLKGRPDCNAHLVVASGGMGKTWLCRSISADILKESAENRLVVLIQAESLRDYINEVGSAHIQVSSVFDLYELHARAQRAERRYDRGTFELAVIAGNIVVIIDGLDELSTVLQERFELSKFLESVTTLSSSLLSSHILLTTRDNLLVHGHDSLRIAQYDLLGFNNEDWTKYAKRRFREHPNREQIVARLNTTLSSSRLADEGGRVVPFFVDVLCNMFEGESHAHADESFCLIEESTPYESNNEISDHVIHSVFRREIRRQNIDLDVPQLVLLIAELISEQGDNFSASSLHHTLDLYYETRAGALYRKICLNPLLQMAGSTIRLKYDFLQAYFRSLFLIHCFQNSSYTPEALNAYAKSNASESPEVAYLRRYFQQRLDLLETQLAALVPHLRDLVKRKEDQKRAELYRRAVSGVLKIYCAARGFGGAKISERLLEFFRGASPGRSIDGLSIYGEFPALDFTGTTVLNSKFQDYKNFAKSKFDGARFIACVFESCMNDSVLSSDLLLAEFDSSCTLDDVAVLVSSAKSNHLIEEQVLETECLNFLRCFFKAGTSYDPKQSWIRFSSKVRGLRAKNFAKLIPDYLIVKTEKSDENYYALAPQFAPSARNFIDNNYKDGNVRRFIEAVK